MPPKRKGATAEDEIEAPPAKITKSTKEIFQKLLQLYLQLSKVVEVKEEMKTTVVHGQEPEPSTSKDLKTEETLTLDDVTWELIKSVKNHVGQGKISWHTLLALQSKFKEALQKYEDAADGCKDIGKGQEK